MATELLAAATTAANSADITVTDSAHIHLRGPDLVLPVCSAFVDIKNSDASYTQLAQLTQDRPSVVIDGLGVYRVRRPQNSVPIAVEQD